MKNETHPPQPPTGISRFLYRLPILIYRLGLGFLLGSRFLLLEHTGRKSGLVKRAVLEVIRKDDVQNVYYVVSAFGDRSDWVQNILKDPNVRIKVGGKDWQAHAQFLDPDLSAREILEYAHRHPRVFRLLAERVLGYEVGGGDEDLAALARTFSVVRIGAKSENGENKREKESGK